MTGHDPRPPGRTPEIPEIHRIVVRHDVDDPHGTAVRWAAAFSTSFDATMMVVAPDEFASSERPPYRREIEEQETASDTEHLLESLGVTADAIEVVIGDVDDRIVDLVDENDVVVVGTDDVVGTTSLALGSAAHGLARRLECPSVVVPRSSATNQGPVLVALSGTSDDERTSIAWASKVAGSLGRDVVAFHAGVSDDRPEGADRRARAMAEDAGAAYVERPEEPAEAGRNVADELDAVFLVVSAKHRGSLGGRLLGSVADALVARASVSARHRDPRLRRRHLNGGRTRPRRCPRPDLGPGVRFPDASTSPRSA